MTGGWDGVASRKPNHQVRFAECATAISSKKYDIKSLPSKGPVGPWGLSLPSWGGAPPPSAIEETIYGLHRIQISIEERANRKDGYDSGMDLLAIANIVEELKAYLYLSLAVVVTFQSINGESRFKELEASLAFDRLAEARQMLAINRRAAIEAIDAIVPLPLRYE